MNNSQCPFKKLLEPQGSKGFPLIGSFFSLNFNLLNFLSSTRHKYGDVAKFKLFGFNFFLVSHPNEIAQVFKDEKIGKYKKTWFHKHHYPVFGNGLFNSYGEDWELQRKQLQPFFKKYYVKKWFDLIVEESLSQNYQLIDNQVSKINIENIVKPLVQNIMSRILFGTKEDVDSKAALLAIDSVSECLPSQGFKSFFLKGFLNRIPTPSNLKYKKSLENIDKSINNMRKKKENDALLFSFSKFMSPTELRDQLTTLYFAGQDTTVSTILWVLYYLAKHPVYQKRAREEVSSYGGAENNNINYEEIDKLVFVSAAIDEAMRLSPAAYVMPRDIENDLKLGKYRLKKFSLVILSMYVTHRHPDFWENPSEYYPDRFLKTKNQAYTYFPFGGGMRMCIGMHLARLEIITFIALFVSSFEFKLDNDYKVKPITHLTLKPKNGLPLIIKKINK